MGMKKVSKFSLKCQLLFNNKKDDKCALCDGENIKYYYDFSFRKFGIYLDRYYICDNCGVDIADDSIYVSWWTYWEKF